MTDNSSDEAQRREHLRISLRLGNDADFLLDCDGMTVQLGHWHWWRPGKLGLGNIKDISRGGVGFDLRLPFASGHETEIAAER